MSISHAAYFYRDAYFYIKIQMTAKREYSLTFTTDAAPQAAFDAINNIQAWWSEDFTGQSRKTGDVFEVQFADIHYSQQELTEIIPAKKISWRVTDSKLNFLKRKDEWTDTTITFEITATDKGKTKIVFTHHGLVPEIECFNACSEGWNYYLKQSLVPLLQTGKGNPNVKGKKK